MVTLFTLSFGSVLFALKAILLLVFKIACICSTGLATKHDSTLQDTSRVEYIQGYIGAMLNAIRCDWYNWFNSGLLYSLTLKNLFE